MPSGKNSTRIAITLSNEDIEILDKFATEWKIKRSTAAAMMLSQVLEISKNVGENLIEMERKISENVDSKIKKK